MGMGTYCYDKCECEYVETAGQSSSHPRIDIEASIKSRSAHGIVESR